MRLIAAALAALVLASCAGVQTLQPQEQGQPAPTRAALPVVQSQTAGCAASATGVGTGITRQTVEVGSYQRDYLLFVPTGTQPGASLPSVTVLHGMGSNAAITLALTGMVAEAQANGYALVVPDTTTGQWRLPDEAAAEVSSPDIDFILAAVDDAGSKVCLDPSRQYAAGMSLGSAMTLALACMPDRQFAAFGGVGAAFYARQCSLAPPAPLVYFHGTADTIVPFEGGEAEGFDVQPVPESMEQWAQHNGCAAQPSTSSVADVTTVTWRACDDQADVDFYTIVDGGHTWPGSPLRLPPEYSEFGSTTDTVNATRAMWNFFSAHRLPTTG